MRTDERFDAAMVAVLRQSFPRFEVRYKDESRFQRLLGLLLFFAPNYMARVTTVMFGKVYFPSRAYLADAPGLQGRILAHEFVHLWDAKNGWFFGLKYLLPQVLALGAFGAFWHPALVWCLAFLLPWPAYWRMRSEARAYGMEIALSRWCPRYPSETRYVTRSVVDSMSGSTYYWMWADRQDLQDRLEATVRSVDDGTIFNGDENAPFRVVHGILEELNHGQRA